MTLCAILVVGRLLDTGNLTIISKSLASASFLMVALTARLLHSSVGRLVFIGLICSAAGDILLLSDSSQFFLFGLVSFLLAHLLYVSAFLVLGTDRRWTLIAAVPLIALSVAVSAWLSPHVGADMQIPVRIYTAVITMMLISAYGVRGAGASLLIPVGATFFYLSDLSVATGQFVQTDFPNYVWGLPLYYGGQVLIALGTARSLSRNQKPAS